MPGGWSDDEDDADPVSLLEAENGRRQARLVQIWIRRGVRRGGYVLTVELLLQLHHIAMVGVIPSAGRLRNRSDLEIFGSSHVPPPDELVPGLLAEACDVVNTEQDWSPVFRAAWILWRICWIHPFDDGNGRTARAIAYVVLCVAMRFELPGVRPVPARIKDRRLAFWKALEAADRACADGTNELGLVPLATLLQDHMIDQVRDAIRSRPNEVR